MRTITINHPAAWEVLVCRPCSEAHGLPWDERYAVGSVDPCSNSDCDETKAGSRLIWNGPVRLANLPA